jgi:hypothetical protein
VDGGARAPGSCDPLQQRLGGFAELGWAERPDAPVGYVREVVLGPGVQPGQGDPAGRDSRREQYPRWATSKGNSGASSLTLDVPAPCHWGHSRRRLTPSRPGPPPGGESG